MKKYILFFILSVFSFNGNAQEELSLKVKDTVQTIANPLAPAKAGFYSAVLPGLGQAHNKKYWKIPIVYGAIGTSLYFYINKYVFNFLTIFK